jgi:hypothetical protein
MQLSTNCLQQWPPKPAAPVCRENVNLLKAEHRLVRGWKTEGRDTSDGDWTWVRNLRQPKTKAE